MAELWPSALQQLLNADSFQYDIGETTIRSENDTGPAKVRRRMTKSTDSLTCSINLSYADWTVLYAYFDITLNGGATPFLFKNPLTQVVETFRFKQPPSVRPLGGLNFLVNMTWERLPQ